jgi:succinate dehydrogenase/fumarate reductase cytochrome b subunit
MKNKKLIFIIALALLFVPMVFATDNIGPFKYDQAFQISNYCNSADCTYMNLSSITYPNGTILYLNKEMTQNGQEFNYTFASTTIGLYHFKTCANPSGDYTCEDDTFDITSSGFIQSSANSIGSLSFLILMIVLMVLFGIIGFKLLKHNTLWILGLFLMFFSVLLLIYNTWLGYEYHRLFTGLPDSSVPEVIFYILMFILVLGLLTGIALLILNWKKVFKYIKKEIKTKEKEDRDVEDWDFDGGKGGY